MVKINIDNKKLFMNDLFKTDKFNEFGFVSAEISSFCKAELENRKSVTDEDSLIWEKMKKSVLSLIADKEEPEVLRLTLTLPKRFMKNLIEKNGITEEISSFNININLDKEGLYFITGITKASFTMDRTADEVWDKYVNTLAVRGNYI